MNEDNNNQEADSRSSVPVSDTGGDVAVAACLHKPIKMTALLLFGLKEIVMENKVNEDVRKTIQSIRNMGSTLNMRLPVARQKSEAIRIKAECERLIELLGGE